MLKKFLMLNTFERDTLSTKVWGLKIEIEIEIEIERERERERVMKCPNSAVLT